MVATLIGWCTHCPQTNTSTQAPQALKRQVQQALWRLGTPPYPAPWPSSANVPSLALFLWRPSAAQNVINVIIWSYWIQKQRSAEWQLTLPIPFDSTTKAERQANTVQYKLTNKQVKILLIFQETWSEDILFSDFKIFTCLSSSGRLCYRREDIGQNFIWMFLPVLHWWNLGEAIVLLTNLNIDK